MSLRQRNFLASRGYEVKEWVGNGAFGRVYRVWEGKNKRYLACKVAHGVKMQKILRHEADLQRRIHHGLFAKFVACLEDGDCTILLMEYVEGTNLAECLQKGHLSQRQAVNIAIQLAEGLGYLHELNGQILYRDLKPENICLVSDGRVRLLDLGCAGTVLEARFSRAGSPGYGPREQLGEGTDCVPGFYSDVYALGKLLHYMLTGDNPCCPPRQKPPLRVYDRKISPLLEQVVSMCVEEDPRLRLPDMKSVLRYLKLLETENATGKLALKRWELAAVVRGVFAGRTEMGFVYERNVCCEREP